MSDVGKRLATEIKSKGFHVAANTDNGCESIKSFYRSLLTWLRIRWAFNLPVACIRTSIDPFAPGPSCCPSLEQTVSGICVTSGFHREVDENCALQGCYAVYSGNFLPTFRDITTTRCVITQKNALLIAGVAETFPAVYGARRFARIRRWSLYEPRESVPRRYTKRFRYQF